MLVVGGPGSGKSELLRTLIASLVAKRPPTVLALLLAEAADGSTFRPCSGLAHAVEVLLPPWTPTPPNGC